MSPGPPRVLSKVSVEGDRLFSGFEDVGLSALLEGFRQRLLGPPEVKSFGDVRLTPLVKYRKGRYHGGVSGPSGFIAELALFRAYGRERNARISPDPAPADVTPGRRLPRAWFGGYLFDHYGHFVIEGTARILHPAVAASNDPVVFFNPTAVATLRPYMEDIFRTCGVDPARVVLCNELLHVDTLQAQQPAFEISGIVRPSSYRQLELPGSPARRGGVVYLSRSALDDARRIDGERDFEERLARDFGADIVHPEELVFAEQVERLSRAACVVGCEGSAFHTLMFLRRVPSTVMLCSGLPHMNYLLCDELCRGDVRYVRASAPDANRKNWRLDIDTAAAAVAEAVTV